MKTNSSTPSSPTPIKAKTTEIAVKRLMPKDKILSKSGEVWTVSKITHLNNKSIVLFDEDKEIDFPSYHFVNKIV